MTLRLSELEAPLDDVEFPNGAKHVPVPFGPAEYRAWREIQEETEALKRGQLLMQIIAACYPTATADDIDSCTPKMLIAIAAHAGRKIEQIRDALKNGAGVEPPEAADAPPTTPPLSPRTSGNTPASRSRKRSGRTSGTSTTASPTASPT